jgi:L-fucose mutarotase/ribose pyranase (RbsD/FucU family)
MKIIQYVLLLTLFSCSDRTPQENNRALESEIKSEAQDWKSEVAETLKLFGHRNWIVVADGAYPQQSNPAIQTITVDASQLEAVAFVNQLIEKAEHVDANIFVDKELEFVPERDAKGIDTYRTKLNELLAGKPVENRLHETIIKELDAAAKLFNVLIIKTDLAIPYTSVFFQLECGYWNAAAEENLRKELKK